MKNLTSQETFIQSKTITIPIISLSPNILPKPQLSPLIILVNGFHKFPHPIKKYLCQLFKLAFLATRERNVDQKKHPFLHSFVRRPFLALSFTCSYRPRPSRPLATSSSLARVHACMRTRLFSQSSSSSRAVRGIVFQMGFERGWPPSPRV